MSPYEYETNNNSYNDNNNYVPSSYSKYATEENKYECQKGPFEGFFVFSAEFCKSKFDDKEIEKIITELEHKAQQVHKVHQVHKVFKVHPV